MIAGQNYSNYYYPTDLPFQPDNLPIDEMIKDGMTLEFWFMRIKTGLPHACELDNCVGILHALVKKCKLLERYLRDVELLFGMGRKSQFSPGSEASGLAGAARIMQMLI